MGKNGDGLIKFLIKGFIAMGVIMVLYLTLYTFFYDSRIYILNLYKVIEGLLMKAKLNFTENFYFNLVVVYLIILTAIYIVGEHIMKLGKEENIKSNNLTLGKGSKMSKNRGKNVGNQH